MSSKCRNGTSAWGIGRVLGEGGEARSPRSVPRRPRGGRGFRGRRGALLWLWPGSLAAQPRLPPARASGGALVPPAVPPRGLGQAAAPSPGDRLARIRPAAAARAQPLLPR